MGLDDNLFGWRSLDVACDDRALAGLMRLKDCEYLLSILLGDGWRSARGVGSPQPKQVIRSSKAIDRRHFAVEDRMRTLPPRDGPEGWRPFR